MSERRVSMRDVALWVSWGLVLILGAMLMLRSPLPVRAARKTELRHITLPGFVPVARYCQAVVVPTEPATIYISGSTGELPNGQLISDDVVAQTRQTMENLKKVLEAAGSDFSHVVKMNILLTDMDHMPELRKARDAYLDPNHPPAMTTGKVLALVGGAKVEIEVIAIAR